MNERIKQFAQQAGFKVDWQHADVQDIKMARFEKFAQLIVEECAGVNYKSTFQDGEFHAREVLEHFGVEE